MSDAPRLLGQQVSIRVVQDGTLVNEINSTASFSEQVLFEITEDGFLGEPVNRFDSILHGYGGKMEFQVNTAKWMNLQKAQESYAKRETPATVFNVVRTDFYSNGESAVITYTDVKWGQAETNVGSRKDYTKVSQDFKTSDRGIQVNSVL